MKCIWISVLATIMFFSCGTSNKIKDGVTAYNYKRYQEAIVLLKQEFESLNRTDTKALQAWYIADSYTKINDYRQANEWFSQSVKLGYGAKALEGQARTYKNLENYVAASQIYDQLELLKPGDPNVTSQKFMCEEAIRWMKEGDDNFSIKKWISDGNYSYYAPAIYERDFIVFTSDNDKATGSDIYSWTGNKLSDLFIASKVDPSDSRPFDAFINSSHNDGTAIFSKNYNEMYFTRCYSEEEGKDDHCKLMYALRDNGIWNESKPLPFVVAGISYGQPALIEKDSVLVFSRVSESGNSGYDLWYSVREELTWSDPLPMPTIINSSGDEFFPTADGDTLYFSSNGWPGMGGLDILKTYLKADNTWAKPVNLRWPYNSGADDFGLILDNINKPNRVLKQGYFVTTRGVEGSEDIYFFEEYKVNASEPEIPVKTDTVTTPELQIFLAGKVMEPVFKVEGEPNSGVIGKTFVPSPFVKITDDLGANLTISANAKGLFIGNIDANRTYKIVVKKQGYLASQVLIAPKTYSIPVDAKTYTINVEVLLEKIYAGKEIVLEQIYYDYDKSDIREDARPILDELSDKLVFNPQIKIELLSHTDCRGEEEYNQNLSQRRAQAAVDYLISKGIDRDRLIAKGYGESLPKIICDCDTCSEQDHQINRRTSFRIL